MSWFRVGSRATLIPGLALLCCGIAPAQMVNLADGPVRVVTKYDLPVGTGPAQNASDINSDASAIGLPFYTGHYLSLGSVELPFNILGTDPALGGNTTTVPTVIVPLRFVFPGDGFPTLDGTNVVTSVENSPIFQSAAYTAGPVDLGFTQFGDALQRAEFWNLPGFSPDYHVLLGLLPVAPTITIAVPSGLGNTYALSGGGLMGVVDTSFFERLVSGLASSYSANQLPIFLTDNVYLGTSGLIQNCCILGYHNSQSPPASTARTWIYAAYAEPGTFAGSQVGVGILDVEPLSHEVSEWLNDPFVGAAVFGFLNFVPPTATQGGGCQINFETGDPLESAPYTFTKVTNGTTYHLQDEVLLPWYLHSIPSFSANSWYTFQNISAKIPLVVNSPATLSGSYTDTATLIWAPVNTSVTADVVYVGRGCPAGSIGPGSPADPYLGDPTGKIALIDRGVCGVSLKVDAAVRAGAVGVLIGLVAPGPPITFSYAGGSDFVPSLVVTQAISNAIKGALAMSSSVNATISRDNAIPPPFSTLCGPG